MDKKKESITLIIGFLGAMLILFGVVMFNQYVLMSLPLVLRMILMIVFYWCIALLPIIMMLYSKDRLLDYGFRKEGIFKQIFIGIALGVAMSLVFTLLPHLLGYGEYFSSSKDYSYLWQYIYEFVECIIAVGLVEEFVFRGFLYEKFKRIFGTDVAAVIGSSLLFGLFHIFGGNILQIIMTGFIGALFCLFRMKIKDCSTLSLIITHGVYDALIVVWTNCLL